MSSHNPCFSGNSFAIEMRLKNVDVYRVTILVLVETPLQFRKHQHYESLQNVTILVLVETPLQFFAKRETSQKKPVTILVLVETPLQFLWHHKKINLMPKSQSLF